VKVLLTGASGFLGKIIFNTLSKEHQIIELSRSSGDYCVSLEKDLIEFKESFDLVIHSAGKAHSIPKTKVEKQEFFDVNVKGTENLLKGLEQAGLPKQFVFISTVSVYGLEFGKLVSENTPLLSKEPYGLSKIGAENTVKSWCEANSVICTILRLPLLVGKDAPGNLGAMLTGIRKGYYFNVGDGKAKKSMVLAEDVAKIIPIVASKGGVFNLTDGLDPDFKTLSEALCVSIGKRNVMILPLYIAKVIGFVGDFFGSNALINSIKIKKITTDLTFDDNKARLVFNWNPRSVTDYVRKNSL
jgi:nucleoside-diphosphate-sugar epimerase